MLSGASVSFVLRIVGAFIQFALSVSIAQKYGAGGVGIYSLALIVAIISSTVGRWGMDQAALKYIAIAENDTWRVRLIFKRAFLFVFFVSLLVNILIYIAAPFLVTWIFHDSSLLQPLRYMSLSILPFSILGLYAECFRARKKIVWHSLIQGVFVPLLTLLLLETLFSHDAVVTGAVLSYVLACFVVMAIAALIWRKLITIPERGAERLCDMQGKDLLTTANSMAWIAIVSVVMGFSETLILGVFSSTESVGLYSVALRLAMIMSMVIFAFNSILAPKFAALHAQGKLGELEILARKSIVIMLLAEVPFIIGYFFFADYLLSFFGETFVEAASVLHILIVGQLINVGAGPIAVILTMSGFERNVKLIVISSAVFSFMLGMVLIPTFGSIGAAWTATLGMLVLTLMASLSVRRNLNIRVLF